MATCQPAHIRCHKEIRTDDFRNIGMFFPEATGVGRVGDGDRRRAVSLHCSAPATVWAVLTVQLLTTFILRPAEHPGHWQPMCFQVLRGTGWLGGHALPALGPYAAPQQMRPMLARGLSTAVVQAQARPWRASCRTSRGRARKRNTSQGRRGPTLGSPRCF